MADSEWHNLHELLSLLMVIVAMFSSPKYQEILVDSDVFCHVKVK